MTDIYELLQHRIRAAIVHTYLAEREALRGEPIRRNWRAPAQAVHNFIRAMRHSSSG